MCYGVLSACLCVEVRWSACQFVAVCCSVSLGSATCMVQRVTAYCSVRCSVLSARQYVTMRYSALQCVAVRCSAWQCVAERGSALQCVAVRCSAWQCVAVRCSALQCVAMRCSVVEAKLMMVVAALSALKSERVCVTVC